MMHHSRQFASFGLVLFWVILTPGVITAVDVGGVYDCNPPWRNDDKVKITFRIDRSQYPSKCAPGTTAGKPVFESSPDGKVTCTVMTDIRISCSFISGTIGCGCTNSNDNGFYVVEYNFIFGPDYHRYWEAEIACLDVNFSKSISFINNGSNCKPVGVLFGCRLRQSSHRLLSLGQSQRAGIRDGRQGQLKILILHEWKYFIPLWWLPLYMEVKCLREEVLAWPLCPWWLLAWKRERGFDGSLCQDATCHWVSWTVGSL
ncbi:hypothetical protein ACOMHN_035415 [Nucella lapillus]